MAVKEKHYIVVDHHNMPTFLGLDHVLWIANRFVTVFHRRSSANRAIQSTLAYAERQGNWPEREKQFYIRLLRPKKDRS